MLKTFRYLSALAIMGLPLCACSDSITSEESEEYTISGTGEKTPLEIAVTLQDAENGAKTRALNGSFETGDQLIAYVQQVLASDDTPPTTYTPKITKLVNWTLSADAISGATNTDGKMTVTSDNSDGKLGMTLYWDDFSNTTDDIRGDKRFLRVGYGFCYNGGVPTTGLADNESAGIIKGWSVKDDQSTENQVDIRKSDLLWAGPQTPISYVHIVADRQPLPVTYTHAMSKVTIELVLDEGYDVYPEGDANVGKAKAFVGKTTTPKLFANKVVTEADAINQTLQTTVAGSEDTGITMYLVDDEKTTPKKRVYEAIIAPTVMKAGNVLATVEVDGNKYELKLTDALLTTVPNGLTGDAWNKQLKAYTESTSEVNGVTLTTISVNSDNSSYNPSSPDGITLSGVNYRLIATLKKQRINVEARITDWTDVTASASGEIRFDADVTESVVGDNLKEITSGSFDLWRSETNKDEDSYDENNADGNLDKASTYTLSTDGKWVGDPTIYWKNGNTPYYFRALAKLLAPETPQDITIQTVGGERDAKQDIDLLWAQTSAHTGKYDGGSKPYAAGAPIDPRTGNVPLTFEHAMSKISVILKNEDGIPPAAQVDLSGAKISIINLYDEGRINIKTGDIDEKFGPVDYDNTETKKDHRTIIDSPVNAEFKWLDNIVIPQKLDKYKDGTTTRETVPTFYQSAELTLIYDDGSSLPEGGGDGTYYLTSSLDRENYVAGDLTAIYADGTSINDPSGNSTYYVTSSLVHIEKEVYTQEEIDAAKAIVEAVTDEVRATASAKAGSVKTPAVTHLATQEDVDKGYAEKVGDEVIDKQQVLYTQDEIDAAKAKVSAVTPEVEATAKLTAGTEKIPEHYKVKDGSKQANVGDLKCYKTRTDSEQHVPGELKSAGDKIMMYITLNDGTRYSIELSKCKDNTGKYVTEWKRGEHYTYEISLGKEEITFRALVKDWVEKTGSGSATLDWD